MEGSIPLLRVDSKENSDSSWVDMASLTRAATCFASWCATLSSVKRKNELTPYASRSWSSYFACGSVPDTSCVASARKLAKLSGGTVSAFLPVMPAGRYFELELSTLWSMPAFHFSLVRQRYSSFARSMRSYMVWKRRKAVYRAWLPKKSLAGLPVGLSASLLAALSVPLLAASLGLEASSLAGWLAGVSSAGLAGGASSKAMTSPPAGALGAGAAAGASPGASLLEGAGGEAAAGAASAAGGAGAAGSASLASFVKNTRRKSLTNTMNFILSLADSVFSAASTTRSNTPARTSASSMPYERCGAVTLPPGPASLSISTARCLISATSALGLRVFLSLLLKNWLWWSSDL
mmetsp:Transcript_49771/g.125109  ORF Transcript_49771/g.125109 Transcript_49771/m.125109 type:complete len:350 (+) Transcript_49771:439-1488(+)